MKRYFLIGPMKKAKKVKLLLVLPGGDGSADFNPFICRVEKSAMPEGFAIAELVAPAWDEQQAENLVWPTKINSYPAAKFSTEEFIDAVIKDSKKHLDIDAKNIYLMAWSSSGPPAYAYSLAPKRQTRGAFIAMSIYRSNIIPKAPDSNGGRFFILHSPDDHLIPISMAETARDQIRAGGGMVHYATYAGGHGWHGDIFTTIRGAVDWLAGDEKS
jgi:predicted esterase